MFFAIYRCDESEVAGKVSRDITKRVEILDTDDCIVEEIAVSDLIRVSGFTIHGFGHVQNVWGYNTSGQRCYELYDGLIKCNGSKLMYEDVPYLIAKLRRSSFMICEFDDPVIRIELTGNCFLLGLVRIHYAKRLGEYLDLILRYEIILEEKRNRMHETFSIYTEVLLKGRKLIGVFDAHTEKGYDNKYVRSIKTSKPIDKVLEAKLSLVGRDTREKELL